METTDKQAAGATAATLVAGSIADLYEAKDRGRPMSLFAFGGFFGTGIGPLIFGYVAQNRSWRYIQYIQVCAKKDEGGAGRG